MNTAMINTPDGLRVTDNDAILTDVISSLARNNTFCPNVKRTIFNLGKHRNEKSHRNDYTLATTVFFVDGSKTTVKNTINDKISVVKEMVKLSDGREIEVESASRESREIGVVYAILKRMIGAPDKNGMVTGGFSSFLNRIVNNAWNQNVEDIKHVEEEKIRKAKLKNVKTTTKAEPQSLHKCVNALDKKISK